MQQQLVRTTVQLDPELYRTVKLKMVEDHLTFREMVHLGLDAVVKDAKPQTAKKSQKKVRFGGYNMGKMKGSLHRKDLYEERLDHIA